MAAAAGATSTAPADDAGSAAAAAAAAAGEGEKSGELLTLDGCTLQPEDVFRVMRGPELACPRGDGTWAGGRDVRLALAEAAEAKVAASREAVDQIVARDGAIVYGINTGFGNFADKAIGRADLERLQHNLIRSHAAGTGTPLTPERVRGLLTLRINVLAKGHSGIKPETLKTLVKACNNWCLSKVPQQGTLGASGDLAPLAHLALGLTGEGDMWDEKNQTYAPAKDVLAANDIEPLRLAAKEGLALINGTQMISSLGCEALIRAERLCIVADIVAAMSLEALRGTVVAMDADIHRARPHSGQRDSAARFRALLNSKAFPSGICASHEHCGKVQDSYTLRCAPQVHGVAKDTADFARTILTTEINSATDNPMVFPGIRDLHEHTAEDAKDDNFKIISGGNFHGEYPGKVLDFLTIAVAELAAISERRIERLVNDSLSELPAFLTKEGGLNSGFMILHCTAAALVSENKVLCHPSTADSIPTSAAKEDHVSMGGFAARKALDVIANVEHVIGTEFLAACQALDFLPEKTTAPLEALKAKLRETVPHMDQDRFVQPDVEAAVALIRNGEIIRLLRPFIKDMEEPGAADLFAVPGDS